MQQVRITEVIATGVSKEKVLTEGVFRGPAGG